MTFESVAVGSLFSQIPYICSECESSFTYECHRVRRVLIYRWSCLRLEGIVVDTVCYVHDDGYLAVSVSHWELGNCTLLYTLTVELSAVYSANLHRQ